MYFWAKKLNLDSNLTTIEAQWLEESTAALGKILHHCPLNIHLKLKEVHILPVRTIQSEDIPSFANLSSINQIN